MRLIIMLLIIVSGSASHWSFAAPRDVICKTMQNKSLLEKVGGNIEKIAEHLSSLESKNDIGPYRLYKKTFSNGSVVRAKVMSIDRQDISKLKKMSFAVQRDLAPFVNEENPGVTSEVVKVGNFLSRRKWLAKLVQTTVCGATACAMYQVSKSALYTSREFFQNIQSVRDLGASIFVISYGVPIAVVGGISTVALVLAPFIQSPGAFGYDQDAETLTSMIEDAEKQITESNDQLEIDLYLSVQPWDGRQRLVRYLKGRDYLVTGSSN